MNLAIFSLLLLSSFFIVFGPKEESKIPTATKIILSQKNDETDNFIILSYFPRNGKGAVHAFLSDSHS